MLNLQMSLLPDESGYLFEADLVHLIAPSPLNETFVVSIPFSRDLSLIIQWCSEGGCIVRYRISNIIVSPCLLFQEIGKVCIAKHWQPVELFPDLYLSHNEQCFQLIIRLLSHYCLCVNVCANILLHFAHCNRTFTCNLHESNDAENQE